MTSFTTSAPTDDTNDDSDVSDIEIDIRVDLSEVIRFLDNWAGAPSYEGATYDSDQGLWGKKRS